MIPVKYLRHDQAGAPVLNGTAGSMIAVLDACLVTGFGLKPVTRLEWAAGVVTATVDAGHGFVSGDVIMITGAVPAEFNGEQRVRVLTPTTFTYPLADAPGATTAGGSPTAKVAPLGWEKVFSGDGKAAYRSRRVEGTGYLLRVDHAADPRNAHVRGYLTMTDIDIGTEPFPTTAIPGAGLTWGASGSADEVARAWSLVGDAGLFYFLPWQTPSYSGSLYGFGDIVSYKPGDAHGCVLIGQESADASYPAWGANPSFVRDGVGRYIAKRYFQIGTSRTFQFCGSGISGSFGRGLPFPSPIDNGVHLYPVQIQDEHLRGECPGLLHCIEEYPFSHRYVLSGVPGLGDNLRDVVFHDVEGGRVSFDITGPWR